MKKSDLAKDHQDRINFAVQQCFNTADWRLVNLLSGGLTGVPVYKIQIQNKLYVIKLEDVHNKNFDLVRNYKILEAVSQQEISPKIYFSSAEKGIVLMKYIESKPRPEASPFWMKKFASIIRSLHNNHSFPKWKSVVEILESLYQKLPFEYAQKNIIDETMKEIKKTENILFDQNDVKLCHCDLNPSNILFNGEEYLLVDWQAVSPQSFYFDLACCATWTYFYNEDLCESFLTYYLEREATEIEKSKYYLMRIFTHIYFGVGFLSLSLQKKPDFQILADAEIEKLPTYLSFMQSISAGKIDLSDASVQQQFGFVFLKTAEKMMDQKYINYLDNLNNKFH